MLPFFAVLFQIQWSLSEHTKPRLQLTVRLFMSGVFSLTVTVLSCNPRNIFKTTVALIDKTLETCCSASLIGVCSCWLSFSLSPAHKCSDWLCVFFFWQPVFRGIPDVWITFKCVLWFRGLEPGSDSVCIFVQSWQPVTVKQWTQWRELFALWESPNLPCLIFLYTSLYYINYCLSINNMCSYMSYIYMSITSDTSLNKKGQ